MPPHAVAFKGDAVSIMDDPIEDCVCDGRFSSRIVSLEKALRSEAKRSQSTTRLMSMPGMGPITAIAIEAFAPTMTTFKKGRDFAAWLGLVPKQHSSGGKQVLGRTSKMGSATSDGY